MTPAVKCADKQKFSYQLLEYSHETNVESYGLEASEKLNLAPETVFKTLVAELDNKSLVVAIIPVTHQLNLKLLAKAAKAKKAQMANPTDVQRSTGYVLGGVSPLGQKKRLATYLDSSAHTLSTIYVSAGKRGLEIALAPVDLLAATNGQLTDLVL